ncbi:MAG: NAD(P)/FAD-dependent oxidoreductase, partial [Halanaerobiales bacterium]
HMETNVLVIGGSAAGIMAAVSAKRHYPKKNITVVRKEDKVLIPCGIPYTMGTIDELENNIIPDTAVTAKNIDLIIDKVVNIDTNTNQAILETKENIKYDKLVLATGSKPLQPPIKNLDVDGVFSIRKNFKQLQAIKNRLNNIDDLVIIGGGFIGIEFADECRKNRDINISIIEIMNHLLSLVCDDKICCKVEDKLSENGVEVHDNSKVTKIIGDKKVKGVKLEDGRELPADMVILAAGVIPNTELAEKAGLKYDSKNGIAVDDYMKTSEPDIFACGDCVEKPSFFGENFEAGKLASIATNEGRIAGTNLFNLKRKKQNSIGIFATIIDGLAIGVAGLTKKQAENEGINVVTGEAEAINRHPADMPGAVKLGVRLVFKEYDGTLIGAQVYGGDSVGEFTNILGLVIAKNMTAEDIATMQVGTHPALTASPISYQLINAAEEAVIKLS